MKENDMVDVGGMTDEELVALVEAVVMEQQRRSLPAAMDSLVRLSLDLDGVVEGEPWRQPTGAHDAYPLGWVVTHNGRTWESTIAGNVWEPGVSGWREQGNEWPQWVQPTGAHDAYPLGARVTHNEVRWVSTVGGNVWEPGTFGWDRYIDSQRQAEED